MEQKKKEINEYLYEEFAYDVTYERSRISYDWPYVLNYLSFLTIGEESYEIYDFNEEQDEYYFLYGNRMTFFKKEGTTLEDLYHQLLGSSWIGEAEPIHINETYIGSEGIPSVINRKEYIKSLALSNLGTRNIKILEGIFLKSKRCYIALVEQEDNLKKSVIGDLFDEPLSVNYSQLSSWRILSITIGKELQKLNLL